MCSHVSMLVIIIIRQDIHKINKLIYNDMNSLWTNINWIKNRLNAFQATEMIISVCNQFKCVSEINFGSIKTKHSTA